MEPRHPVRVTGAFCNHYARPLQIDFRQSASVWWYGIIEFQDAGGREWKLSPAKQFQCMHGVQIGSQVNPSFGGLPVSLQVVAG
jgi:hypothetical protein